MASQPEGSEFERDACYAYINGCAWVPICNGIFRRHDRNNKLCKNMCKTCGTCSRHVENCARHVKNCARASLQETMCRNHCKRQCADIIARDNVQASLQETMCKHHCKRQCANIIVEKMCMKKALISAHFVCARRSFHMRAENDNKFCSRQMMYEQRTLHHPLMQQELQDIDTTLWQFITVSGGLIKGQQLKP